MISNLIYVRTFFQKKRVFYCLEQSLFNSCVHQFGNLNNFALKKLLDKQINNKGQMYEALKDSFKQANSLIYRSNSNPYKVINIKGVQKNLEFKIILISRRPLIKTKKGTISQFLVADQTACGYMNFFDEFGESLQEGDILYVSGVYTSYHKEMLIIFQGSQSIIKRIGKWMMKFSTQINISMGQNRPQEKKIKEDFPQN